MNAVGYLNMHTKTRKVQDQEWKDAEWTDCMQKWETSMEEICWNFWSYRKNKDWITEQNMKEQMNQVKD